MGEIHKDLREIHSVGKLTVESLVYARAPEGSLARAIYLAGISEAREGFEFVRLSPRMSQVLVCYSGEGEVWFQDRWVRCKEGEAYITPSAILHRYRAIRGKQWNLCWVIYLQGVADSPLKDLKAPIFTKINPQPLRHAIAGWHHESVSRKDPEMVMRWAELVHSYIVDLTRQWQRTERLWALWEKVDRQVSSPWTLLSLAEAACMSPENLRKVCQKELGCSPMEQVRRLRMQRAASALLTSPSKIEAIGLSVGYENAFAFSTAFKRELGSSPSVYRLKTK